SLLDIDLGTYPYVTSSNSDACGVSSGAGVSPKRVGMVLGVLKAYTTRVGGGPFPTELPADLGNRLRERGQEYGATTGRPRRCGWADAVALRYAVQVNGVDALAVMKLDVLDDSPEIRVAVAYRIGGKETTHFPGDLQALASAEPVYESFPGWNSVTSEARTMSDLPANARRYLDFLQSRCAVPISMVSVGARRKEVIRCS
ncbi:MAG: adenylosuccinate synthetase, partial [Planctomycetes bacterium]|nr:adenylosuccinate synthetase [Planctomycetota bacterium]